MEIRTEQIANLLKQTRLFSDVDERVLLELASKTDIEEFDEGQTIFEKGDTDGKAYLVFKGQIGIYRDGFLMAHYGDNNIFAEFSMLDGSSYGASAKADKASTLISLSRNNFLDAVRSEGGLAECVIKNLSRRLKRHL